MLNGLVPEYEELVREKTAQMFEESKHFGQAIRYLKIRHAPREEYDQRFEDRQKELARIQEKFSAKVKTLVKGGIKAMSPDRR